MTLRIICPYCHRPIDPLTLEDAVGGGTHYLICPECDDLIALPADFDSPLPAPNTHPAENHRL
ncbi:MAG: hypothetical protein QM739_15420 [Propionivibrio sp.]